MMTNDSKDQGREAFEAWAKSTGLDILSAPGWSNADYISLPTEDAWRGFKAALATSASALASDEAVQEPIYQINEGRERYIWADVGGAIYAVTAPSDRRIVYAASPAASSAATISDAASGLTDERRRLMDVLCKHWGAMLTTQVIDKIIDSILATSQAATTAGAQDERATDGRAPYGNCRFKICDLPGQCIGEGKCHHPAVAAARAASSATAPLTSDCDAAPEWIVNDLGELGVKVGSRFFFLYKGGNLEYGADAKDGVALHDDGAPMHYRIVGKREFGETCHPLAWVQRNRSEDRYIDNLVYHPGLSFGKPEDGDWKPLPSAQSTNGEQS